MKPGSVSAPPKERRVSRARPPGAPLADLVQLTTLPAWWRGSTPGAIAEGLRDLLAGMLAPETVIVELRDPSTGEPLVASADALPAAARTAAQAPTNGGRAVRLARFPVGPEGELGTLTVGSRRPGFPSRTERVLLWMAASQAALALQHASLATVGRLAEALLVRASAVRTAAKARSVRDPATVPPPIPRRQPMITALLTPPVGPDDHVEGRDDAPVTLVEYGDFECPHCAAAYPVVEAARARLGEGLRFAYRHFPLAEVHPHAVRAAEAAEAAGAQGKFWEMHRLLFLNQHALEDEDLLRYAAMLGLDLARFGDELATHAHAPRVRRDFLSGVSSGVEGTPTFFVNGVRYDGPWSDPALFIAALALAEQGVAVP